MRRKPRPIGVAVIPRSGDEGVTEVLPPCIAQPYEF